MEKNVTDLQIQRWREFWQIYESTAEDLNLYISKIAKFMKWVLSCTSVVGNARMNVVPFVGERSAVVWVVTIGVDLVPGVLGETVEAADPQKTLLVLK